MISAALIVMASGAAAAIHCPSFLSAAPPSPPFERVGQAPTAQAALRGVSLYSGLPGEEDKPAPAALVPEVEERQGRPVKSTWDLQAAPNERFLLVCRYRGSSAYLRMSLPTEISRCVWTDLPGRKALACR